MLKKIIILILTAFLLLSCGKVDDIINPNADYIYFYGKTCPHCQEVGKYFDKNNTMDKYPIEKREVFYNSDNQLLFQKQLKELGIPSEQAGVPFVIKKSDSIYYMGKDDVIELFK